MKSLEYISSDEKNVITQIVEGYELSLQNMKNDSSSIFDSPGCLLYALFYDFRDKKNPCRVDLYNRKTSLYAVYFLENVYDGKQITQRINLKKVEVVSRVNFIKSLYEDNLIFFEEDKECNMPFYTEPTAEKEKEWSEKGIHRYSGPIKSQSLFEFVNTYYGSRVIPSAILQGYYKCKFKTIEERRANKTNRISWSAIVVAILIALGSPWLMTKCSHTTIKQEQIDTIVNAISSEETGVYLNECQLDSLIQVIRNLKGRDVINGKVENEKH